MVVHHCVRQTDHPNLTGVLSALAGYDTPAGSLATSSRPRHCHRRAEFPALRDGGTRPSSQCEPMHRWSLLSVNAPRRHPVCIRQIAAVLTGRCDTRVAAQTLLVYSLLGGRFWSVLRSTISKIGPPSGDDVARNPAHLELLIRLLL